MDMLDSIRTTLELNGNLSNQVKEDIFELVVLFNKNFSNVDLTNLKKRLSSLSIKKLNKFLNNDVSMYDNRTNIIYINGSRLDGGYDGKHILMFNLLQMIASNENQIGFDKDGKFEALNTGYTEILTNYLVGNNSDKLLFPDEAVETNLISIMLGSDTLEQAYFNNDTDLLVKGFAKVGFEI